MGVERGGFFELARAREPLIMGCARGGGEKRAEGWGSISSGGTKHPARARAAIYAGGADPERAQSKFRR